VARAFRTNGDLNRFVLSKTWRQVLVRAFMLALGAYFNIYLLLSSIANAVSKKSIAKGSAVA
jgi:hypothetical protein